MQEQERKFWERCAIARLQGRSSIHESWSREQLARDAFEHADAMLEERKARLQREDLE